MPGGAAITVAGERVSEGADRSDVVVASGKAVTTEGLAGFIAGALGKTAAVGGSGGVSGNGSFGEGQMFTGGAGERDGGMGLFGGVVGVVLLAVVGRGIA